MVTGWNKREAARILKISYKALFYKMANAGIRRVR
jgi:DNA-binding NtrC family response regulator